MNRFYVLLLAVAGFSLAAYAQSMAYVAATANEDATAPPLTFRAAWARAAASEDVSHAGDDLPVLARLPPCTPASIRATAREGVPAASAALPAPDGSSHVAGVTRHIDCTLVDLDMK